MPNKNFDGIKKLSDEELKQSRKIILDYIGEKDKRDKRPIKNIIDNKSEKEPFFSFKKRKMLDSLSSGNKKIINMKDKEIVNEKKQNINIDDKEKKEFLLKDFNNDKQSRSKQAGNDKHFVKKNNYSKIMEEIQEIKSEYKIDSINQNKEIEAGIVKRKSERDKKLKINKKKEEKKLRKQENIKLKKRARQDKKFKINQKKEEKKRKRILKRKQMKKKIIKVLFPSYGM